ncbi:ABC transporter substrate-binding protein [Aureibacillus halotolerans]|uniref:ABC-type glycerol-3-phosphate transport system substrate-binding protein n=1 Tax=Aureibacillus halotolerans TaxID=1508390 RepID=A0A4R6UDQ0_9BACI|nr:extracellular solute-binding protein [Aureibacillus halotolerans]TDQ41224.1 ABC-type glycerol-3-phosphate transport system substrate-binding protein [Aureibacillus halotolerans]
MKRFWSFGLLLILSLGILAACSGGGEETGSSEDAVTLTLWNRYPELRDPFDKLISDFEKEHPNIKIEKQDLPLDSHYAQLQTALSEDQLPDIFTTALGLKDLVEADAVKNLNEVFTEDVKSQFVEGVWTENGTTLNDNVYVFPFLSPKSGAYIMYYNKSILEEFGYTESDIPRSWDEFVEFGKELRAASGDTIYPLSWTNEGWANEGLVNMMSTAITPEVPWNMNYKEGQPTFTQPGKIESIHYLKRLLDEGVMAPASIETNVSKAEANFTAGANAFWISGNWTGMQLTNSYGFTDWGVVPIPTKNGDPYYYPAGRQVDGFSVSQDTEHWEEVKIFLEYSIENLHQTLYVEPGIGIPAKKDVGGEAAYPQFADIRDLMNELAISVPNPVQNNLAIIEFQRDYTGKLDAQDSGALIGGYLAGAVPDVEAELKKQEEKHRAMFSETLEQHPDVSREDFIFENWTPFEPFTAEDYK